MPQFFSWSQVQVLNGATMQKLDLAKFRSYLVILVIFRKIFLYQSDIGCFLAKIGVPGHFEAKSVKTASIFFQVPNLSLNGATMQKLDLI